MQSIFSLKISDNRIYGLDILRAFAIIFVILVHSDTMLPEWLFHKMYYFILDGVSIFFVLSGFLIGGILIKTFENATPSKRSLLNFWLRRWLRTLPNYFLILSILLILKSFFNTEFYALDYWTYFIFSQNLFTVHPSFFPEAWSLSVEEWFYLIIPIFISLLYLAKFSVKRAVLLTIVLIIILVTWYRYVRLGQVSIDNFKEWDFLIRKQVFTRLDSLMYGVLGAYLSYYYAEYWLKYKNYLFALGLFIFVLFKLGILSSGKYDLFQSVFSLSLFSVATLLLLPFLSTIKKGNGLLYKIVTLISLISYSMYLTHLSIVQGWILGRINLNELNLGWQQFLVIKYTLYWVLTLVLSFLLYKYFEVPMMNLRDKIKVGSSGVVPKFKFW